MLKEGRDDRILTKQVIQLVAINRDHLTPLIIDPGGLLFLCISLYFNPIRSYLFNGSLEVEFKQMTFDGSLSSRKSSSSHGLVQI